MNTPVPTDAVTEQAAFWCMRLNEADCTAQERAEFAAWLAQSPLHASEYAAMEDIWTVSEHLPRPALPAPVPRRRRRWLAQAAAVLAAVPLAGLLGWYQNWLPDSYHRYQATDTARTVQLPDGSQVELNLNSSLTYANYRDHRDVRMSDGEAFFQVQHDARHPFVVRAGHGSITVTGTRFNVWAYQQQTVVTLVEGSVRVLSDVDRPDQVAYLTPGLQARYGDAGGLPQVSPADTEQALAWREGKLVLDNLSLAEALPRINRYLAQPVLLGDRASGELRVGGLYNTGNMSQLVQLLPKVLPVYLSRNSEGQVVINRRRGNLKG